MAQEAGYSRYVAITKSDAVDIDGQLTSTQGANVTACDAIYAVAGTVIAIGRDGKSVTFTISAGTQAILPIQARAVGASSSATSMIALYR